MLLPHALVTAVAGRYADFAEIGAACVRMIGKELTNRPERAVPPGPGNPGVLQPEGVLY